MQIKIAVLNESTVVKDADVQAWVTAQQIQISRDFAPIWGVDATLNFYPSKVPPSDSWQLVILDDSDQADALGYHELTAAGLPLGKVFAASDIQAGMSWTVTASHEQLEMLIDPWINECVVVNTSNGTTAFFAKEVCDAVEADSLGYIISKGSYPGVTADVLLSDFVYPAWFVPGATGKVDFLGHITSPFQIAAGGYIGVITLTANEQWTQIQANRKPGGPAAPRGSRRWRRSFPDDLWRRSRK
jgi:hypothetical protein